MSTTDLAIDVGSFLSPRRVLILSGGAGHSFDETTPQLVDLLELLDPQIEVTVVSEPSELERLSHDLLVVNALWWQMLADRYRNVRQELSRTTPAAARQRIEEHIAAGGAVLAFHTAVICFDDWPRWGQICGASWNWERSHHPPFDAEHPVRIDPTAHPLTRGLHPFDLIDEVYGFLDLAPDNEILATASHSGEDHPLVMRRVDGDARIAVDVLGHDRRSLESAEHRELLGRVVGWLLRVGNDDLEPEAGTR